MSYGPPDWIAEALAYGTHDPEKSDVENEDALHAAPKRSVDHVLARVLAMQPDPPTYREPRPMSPALVEALDSWAEDPVIGRRLGETDAALRDRLVALCRKVGVPTE